MQHAALDVLGALGAEVVDIDGADAPGVVVAVPPIEHAVLPIVASLVPPFACGVVMALAVAVEYGGVSVLPCLSINIIGGKGVVERAPERHAADDDDGVVVAQTIGVVGIAKRHQSRRGKIDADAAPAALTCHEVAS